MLFMLLLTVFLNTVDAKEIVATHEWQLLSENDTIPAGLYVKMDLSTGEKWAKLATDERSRDDDIKAAIHKERIEAATMDANGAITIVEEDEPATP
eukprot:CAMPEP_0181104306 /NCGR_PEP_ID=MMETSP1071-20121207/15352_1 /TAXON_ID=35127 /ORGANISM="Thalassiosira sp., Strain NH16" /LENGTH=95 /DNA_ID=CAMNT_0023187485 /DNA_START=109 /DNA_END=396 /DNA_ORIENTATION=+